MAFTVQTTDLRRRGREILDRVRLKHEPAIVQSYDTPQAVLIPYDQYEEFLAWRASAEKRTVYLDKLYRIAEEVSARASLSEVEASALVEEAIDKTRGA
jgi:prevent-host-death family protein